MLIVVSTEDQCARPPCRSDSGVDEMHLRLLSSPKIFKCSPCSLPEARTYKSLRRSLFNPRFHRAVSYRGFLSSTKGVFSLIRRILRLAEASRQLIERGVLSLLVGRGHFASCRGLARPLLCPGTNIHSESRSLLDDEVPLT